MTNLWVYQVDAFAARAFQGNPAAVMPLGAFLPDALLQQIAEENALSETAFVVPRAEDGDFDLRWFTPKNEVDLCGHATLATALVLFRHGDRERTSARFHTRSGVLTVRAEGRGFVLDFPSWPPRPSSADVAAVSAALGARPTELVASRDLVAVFDSAEQVRALAPNFDLVAKLDTFALAVTAPGTGGDRDVDFVSRFFAPKEGIPEDPVTGSLHSTLTPLWAARLGKMALRARQVSARGGELGCTLRGDRVDIYGEGVLVKRGEMFLGETNDEVRP